MNTSEKYVGKIIDRRYHIKKIIGVGGMAVVFEAVDVVLNRTVALKMLREELADDEEAVKRFINESKAVSMLSHPNIVKIFDVSIKGRLKYIVMERIEGITLKSYMQKKGALSNDEILSYSEQVLKALEHAHSKGIIHRDIKPQNILLLRNGKVKITDFGIAVLSTTEQSTNGKAIGTVYYISPEQASGKETDTRSDLYSVGVLMYEMATGTLPFNADTPVSVAIMQVKNKPEPPSVHKSDIPYGLEQIILGAMEKNPERRFQSAEQMLKYVERIRLNPEYIFKTRDNSEKKESSTVKMAPPVKRKKKKRSSPQSKSMFPIILGVSVAFVIVLVVSAITMLDMILTKENQNAPETIIVPNIVGELFNDDTSDKLLDPSIFRYEIEYVYDESPAGTVIKQDPAGNSKKKIQKNITYCHIKLTVSHGTELVYVPDLVAMEYREAQIFAEKNGFKIKIEEIVSDRFPVGDVVKTIPSAKEQVAFGSTITIYKSVGPEHVRVTAEDYTGITPKQAYTKINGDFKIGNVTYEYSDTVAKGYIISQSLEVGTLYIKHTQIDFVISLGVAPPPETTEPPTSEPQETDGPVSTDNTPSSTEETTTTLEDQNDQI